MSAMQLPTSFDNIHLRIGCLRDGGNGGCAIVHADGALQFRPLTGAVTVLSSVGGV